MNVMAIGINAAAHGPAANPPQTTDAQSGKDLPAAGKPAPQAAATGDTLSIEKAVEQINTYLRDSKREIEFHVDRDSGRTIMRITDARGEVVRQVPSEEVLQIATTLGGGNFHSINRLA